MVSVYTNGFLCLLSGLVVLVTGAWQNQALPFDISMIRYALSLYFPGFGLFILTVSTILFTFSTILGNSYNGTQCFLFVTKNQWVYVYYLLIGFVVYLGAIADVKFVWSVVDFFAIPVAIPHIIGIVILSFKKAHLLKPTISSNVQ